MSDAILETLAYHAVFHFPLTRDELYRYLVTDNPRGLPAIEKDLAAIKKSRSVGEKNKMIFLGHSEVWVRERQGKIPLVNEKMEIASRAAQLFSILPWIKMVAVTGALAMKNTQEDDDIDLMIVTSQNRLWTMRPLIILFTILFFKRRIPVIRYPLSAIRYRNALCLNLWLDEAALAIPETQRNLYTAHELAQMKPLVNKDGVYEQMMLENRWGEKFLANAWQEIEGRRPKEKGQSKQQNKILNFLNKVAFQIQLWYMWPKMTTERVELHAAYFHPGNRSNSVLIQYNTFHEALRSRNSNSKFR